jgi:hypothetical protein
LASEVRRLAGRRLAATLEVTTAFDARLLSEVFAVLTEPPVRDVHLACGATDMRKSIDGLAAIVQLGFDLDPFSEAWFVFCNKQWCKLNNFLLDGRLEIDNNRSERSIKNFVIGRKNWLFANTPKGATASATIYNIVETAKENGLIPFEYLTYLFARLPNIDVLDPSAVDKLLPHSLELPDHVRMPVKKL